MKAKHSPPALPEEGVALLQDALSHFHLSTEKLQESYRQLQQRVSSLNLELEKKNVKLEESLREQEKIKDYLFNILESLNCGVMVVDGEGRVTTLNSSAEEITGIDRGEIEGKPLYPTVEKLFPPELVFGIHFGNLLDEERECTFSKRDGTQLQIKMLVVPLRGKTAEGRVVIFQDITELKRLEEQAERSNRLMAMGEIAVSIAHEVRNPLGSIELLASLLRREVGEDEEKRRLVDQILVGVQSIDCIINNLLQFTKPQCPLLREINVQALLEETLHFVTPSLMQHRIALVTNYEAGVPFILGDGELLKQVFLNLIWNAIQAMPHGGQLKVATQVTPTRGIHYKGNKGFLEVRLIDSGVGIPEEYIQQIFNPFFTTKEKGTGLGLAIAHKIVEVHRGMIRVESTVGKGSTFTVTLPLKE